jgi:transposase
MRGKVAQIDWLDGDDAAALKRLYLAEKRADVKPRLHLLWLVRGGMQIREAAGAVGTHERTARQWVAWYREGGVEAVASKKSCGKGRTSRLAPEQCRELFQVSAQEGFASAAEVAQWVERRFGVMYQAGSVYGLLSRLGIRLKVPRPQNAKADAAVQEAWQKGG